MVRGTRPELSPLASNISGISKRTRRCGSELMHFTGVIPARKWRPKQGSFQSGPLNKTIRSRAVPI